MKARVADLDLYFDAAWKGTGEPTVPPFEYPTGAIPHAVVAWLPTNCLILLPDSERPKFLCPLPPPKAANAAKAAKATPKATPKAKAAEQAAGAPALKKSRGRQTGQTYETGLLKYNSLSGCSVMPSHLTTSISEKEASVQGQNAQLRDGLKDKRSEIAKLNEVIKALQAAAEKHHLRCEMVYMEVKTQAMWSDSKVPKEDIKDFPELPHAL